MTLAQVQAAVALVAALIVTWAGLMVAVALMLPLQTGKAETALETTPRRCFFSGLGMLLLFTLGIFLTNLPNGLAKLLGLLLLLALGAVVSVGAAGLTQLMGKRIGEMSGAKTSFGALTRGSAVYSLALFFPLIGWYLLAPISAVFALGAGAIALWPKRRRALAPPVSSQTLLEGQGAA